MDGLFLFWILQIFFLIFLLGSLMIFCELKLYLYIFYNVILGCDGRVGFILSLIIFNKTFITEDILMSFYGIGNYLRP